MDILYPLALLACPIGMGAMMWMMMRGHSNDTESTHRDEQIAELRAKLDELSRSDDRPSA